MASIGQRKLRENQNFECCNFTHLSVRIYSNRNLATSFREAATCPDTEVLNQTCEDDSLNPLSANPTKWSNTLKQFVGNLPTN